jgi:hypothetical protein
MVSLKFLRFFVIEPKERGVWQDSKEITADSTNGQAGCLLTDRLMTGREAGGALIGDIQESKWLSDRLMTYVKVDDIQIG